MISKIVPNNVSVYNQHNLNQNSKKTSFNANSETLNKELTTKQKSVILASSATGVLSVVALLAKLKGFSLNPARIIKTPLKELALFKFKPQDKVVEFDAPPVIVAVASGSIAGGYVGGSIVDKENQKSKKREILNQILGNVLVPVGCVWAGAKQYEKFANRIENAIPQINKQGKVFDFINKFFKQIPNLAATLGFLGIGIYAGNKVSNFINDKLYNKKVERNIKTTDFAPHFDDLCMATSMMNKDASFGAKLSRFIPLALLVPGYETGIARNEE